VQMPNVKFVKSTRVLHVLVVFLFPTSAEARAVTDADVG